MSPTVFWIQMQILLKKGGNISMVFLDSLMKMLASELHAIYFEYVLKELWPKYERHWDNMLSQQGISNCKHIAKYWAAMLISVCLRLMMLRMLHFDQQPFYFIFYAANEGTIITGVDITYFYLCWI